MDFAEQLRILKAAKDNPALLALATVDLAHHSLPEAERAQIKHALLAAAVPHWCDRNFLAALLQITVKESARLLRLLETLTVIEPFPARGRHAVNVQSDARVLLRRYLQRTDPKRWKSLAQHAHAHVAKIQKDHTRIEALFHLFSFDQSAASEQCLELEVELDRNGSVDSRRALVISLIELINFGPRPEQNARQADASASQQSEVVPSKSARFRQKGRRRKFDVFLCHNSQDKREVEAIGAELKKRDILPWLDKWELPPGKHWQSLLESQIETIRSAAVFVGSSGFGPWQNEELRAFLSQFQARGLPVIPVILETVTAVPTLPPFLAGRTWVDFRDTESLPLPMLIWGVTGKRPSELP